MVIDYVATCTGSGVAAHPDLFTCDSNRCLVGGSFYDDFSESGTFGLYTWGTIVSGVLRQYEISSPGRRYRSAGHDCGVAGHFGDHCCLLPPPPLWGHWWRLTLVVRFRGRRLRECHFRCFRFRPG